MAFKPSFTVELSKRYSEEERAAIAAEIIDFIVTRTENGKDVDNKRFPKYEKEYSELKGQSNVDLRLSGEMLTELGLLKSEKGKITIGYDKDSPIVGKVEGNCLGTYGQTKPIPNKQRNFLGIKDTDATKIIKKYPLSDKEKRSERVDKLALGEIVSEDILKLIDFDF